MGETRDISHAVLVSEQPLPDVGPLGTNPVKQDPSKVTKLVVDISSRCNHATRSVTWSSVSLNVFDIM